MPLSVSRNVLAHFHPLQNGMASRQEGRNQGSLAAQIGEEAIGLLRLRGVSGKPIAGGSVIEEEAALVAAAEAGARTRYGA